MRTLDEVRLAPAERTAIEAAAAALRARFPVTDIVLYGSKARGDSDPESDIDLLVLTSRPLDDEEQRRIWSDLHEIACASTCLLSPLTVESPFLARGVHSVSADPHRSRAARRVLSSRGELAGDRRVLSASVRAERMPIGKLW